MSLWNIRITDRFHTIQTAPVLLCIMKRSDIMNWEGTLWIENIKLEVPRVFQQPRHQIFMKFYDSKKKCHIVSFNDWSLKKNTPQTAGEVFTSFLPRRSFWQRVWRQTRGTVQSAEMRGNFWSSTSTCPPWGHATKHWKVKRKTPDWSEWRNGVLDDLGGKDPGSFEEGKNIDIYTSDV